MQGIQLHGLAPETHPNFGYTRSSPPGRWPATGGDEGADQDGDDPTSRKGCSKDCPCAPLICWTCQYEDEADPWPRPSSPREPDNSTENH